MDLDTETLDLVDAARVRQECYSLDRDVRPMACVCVRTSQLPEIKQILEQHVLYYRCTQEGTHHTEVLITKYPHLLRVMDEVNAIASPYLKHWCHGKLFGYSESAILSFLESLDENR